MAHVGRRHGSQPGASTFGVDSIGLADRIELDTVIQGSTRPLGGDVRLRDPKLSSDGSQTDVLRSEVSPSIQFPPTMTKAAVCGESQRCRVQSFTRMSTGIERSLFPCKKAGEKSVVPHAGRAQSFQDDADEIRHVRSICFVFFPSGHDILWVGTSQSLREAVPPNRILPPWARTLQYRLDCIQKEQLFQTDASCISSTMADFNSKLQRQDVRIRSARVQPPFIQDALLPRRLG